MLLLVREDYTRTTIGILACVYRTNNARQVSWKTNPHKSYPQRKESHELMSLLCAGKDIPQSVSTGYRLDTTQSRNVLSCKMQSTGFDVWITSSCIEHMFTYLPCFEHINKQSFQKRNVLLRLYRIVKDVDPSRQDMAFHTTSFSLCYGFCAKQWGVLK